MLGWLHKNAKNDARGMIVALYVLFTLSLVFAQRCLRPEQDAPPSINQIDLADLSRLAPAKHTTDANSAQTREFANQSIAVGKVAIAASDAAICTNFAHISGAHRAAQTFAAHIAARLPAAYEASTRTRAPPVPST